MSSYHHSDFQKRPSHPNHQLPIEHQKPLATGQQSCHAVPHFKAHLPLESQQDDLWLSHHPRGWGTTSMSIYNHTQCCHYGGHMGRDELNQSPRLILYGYHDTAPKAKRGKKWFLLKIDTGKELKLFLGAKMSRYRVPYRSTHFRTQ